MEFALPMEEHQQEHEMPLLAPVPQMMMGDDDEKHIGEHHQHAQQDQTTSNNKPEEPSQGQQQHQQQQQQQDAPTTLPSKRKQGSMRRKASTSTLKNGSNKPSLTLLQRLRNCCCLCADEQDEELEQFLLASAVDAGAASGVSLRRKSDLDTALRSPVAQTLKRRRAGGSGVRHHQQQQRPEGGAGGGAEAGGRVGGAGASEQLVEDDQPLATLKMSGNMTLLISKLRMLLTLFIPEAGNVFCQFHPAENASQLVLALEYFIYLQDTLLSPIERLEVIHRSLPNALTDHQATALVRACKRCALEVANAETFVEELRKPGELLCIRRMLTPALDRHFEFVDPQVAPQLLRTHFENEYWKAKAAAASQAVGGGGGGGGGRGGGSGALNLDGDEDNNDHMSMMMMSSPSFAGSMTASSPNLFDQQQQGALPAATGKTKDGAEDMEALLKTALAGATSGGGNPQQQNNNNNNNNRSGLLGNGLVENEGAYAAMLMEENELTRKRNERILDRIKTFPAFSTNFSGICNQQQQQQQRPQDDHHGGDEAGAGGAGSLLAGLVSEDDDAATRQRLLSTSVYGGGGSGSGATAAGGGGAAGIGGGGVGADGKMFGSSKLTGAGAAAAALAKLQSLNEQSRKTVLRTPKMSLLNFLHAWLHSDTDCSAVLSERDVVKMLHDVGVYVTLTHVRDLVAAVSGSSVPIAMYDISTALIVYEELSNVVGLPVFVQAAGDVEPAHALKEIKKFFKTQQFESKERTHLLLSHMGSSHDQKEYGDRLLQEQLALGEEEANRNNNNNNNNNNSNNSGRQSPTTSNNINERSATPPTASTATTTAKGNHNDDDNGGAPTTSVKKFGQEHHLAKNQQQICTHQQHMYFPHQLQLILRDNRLNSWFAAETQQIDTRAMAHMSITDFFICSSHKTYLGGPQFGAMSVSLEMIAHCLLREACRCVEIDCWEDRRGHKPIVTNGGMTSASATLDDVLMVIGRCAFARASYPLIVMLGVYGGVEFQQKLAEKLKDHFGRRILRAAKVAKFIERNKPLTPDSLRGKIILCASVSLENTAVVDGTRACVPALLRLLAAHRVETNAQWKGSRNNTDCIGLWNDVEDPSTTTTTTTAKQAATATTNPSSASRFSSSAAAAGGGAGTSSSSGHHQQLRRTGGSKLQYSTSKHVAPGRVWQAPRRGKMMIDGVATVSSAVGGGRGGGFDDLNDDGDDEGKQQQQLQHPLDSIDPLFAPGAESMLQRLSPNTARIDSSNLEPVRYWLSGTNMAALNFQVVNDPGLRMNRDLFLATNGGTGFIPKPDILWRRSGAATDVAAPGSSSSSSSAAALSKYIPEALPKCQLRIEVYCASMLPPPLEVVNFSPNSGFSVLIQLIVHEVKPHQSSAAVVVPSESSSTILHPASHSGEEDFWASSGSGGGTAARRQSSGVASSAGSTNTAPSTSKKTASSSSHHRRPPDVVTHRYRTALVQDNLHSPAWDDEVWELDIDHPSAAVLTVQVLACRHDEDLATPMLVGERSIFVHQLQQGVRMVPLIGQDGMAIDHPYSGVMCRFALTPDAIVNAPISPTAYGDDDDDDAAAGLLSSASQRQHHHHHHQPGSAQDSTLFGSASGGNFSGGGASGSLHLPMDGTLSSADVFFGKHYASNNDAIAPSESMAVQQSVSNFI